MATSDRRRATSRAYRVCLLWLLTAAVAPASASLAAPPAGAPGQAHAQPPPPSRALLDRYCVTCHNERLRTGGLMLDAADVDRVDLHRETFEKVVRKLRSGQMPPQGRARPDRTAVRTFVRALEAELDRVGAAAPNPGRVASHRLNRTEYVNVVRDLLALEIDGEALLPGDMAGFGFDNNAQVLGMTPALMDRYITAATKVSRLALGTPENRPLRQVYRLPMTMRQDARMSEATPFASRGGIAVRHTFPLDGTYLFRVRLQRDIGDSIGGSIASREYQIDLRIDHALVERLTVGGKFRGQRTRYVGGGGIAPPEDDLVARQIAFYNQTADDGLDVRLPVKGGTRLVSVTFANVAPTAVGGIGDGLVPGLGTLEIVGPFDGRTPADTPSRERVFVCRPDGPADEELCARDILRTLTRRAYRRPITDVDLDPLLAIYEAGRDAGDFETGIALALEALLSMPAFLLRAEAEPSGAQVGTIFPITDVELASRLSFFLWRSMPDDELLDLAEQGTLSDPVVLARQTRRMLSDRKSVV